MTLFNFFRKPSWMLIMIGLLVTGACVPNGHSRTEDQDVNQEEAPPQIAKRPIPKRLPIDEEALLNQELEFRELWIWSYLDEEGQEQSLWVYHHDQYDIWLFDKHSSYGMSDEQTDWVLGLPGGVYWMAYQDPEMGAPPRKIRIQLDLSAYGHFGKDYQKTGKTSNFGKPETGFATYKGVEYRQPAKQGMLEDASIYLAETSFDFSPIYCFNRIDGDAKLPIEFPADIKFNQLLLSQSFKFYGVYANCRYVETGPNSHWINPSDYLSE